MSTARFPKQAYVRRLERLYAELGEWRDRYYGLSRQAFDRRTAEGYYDRERVLADAQRLTMDVVMCLDGLPRVS